MWNNFRGVRNQRTLNCSLVDHLPKVTELILTFCNLDPVYKIRK